jgi:hypothetical protein
MTAQIGQHPASVGAEAVYRRWVEIVGSPLSAQRRGEFLAKATVLGLGTASEQELVDAGRRAWSAGNTLLLEDWRAEIESPGVSALRAVPGGWQDDPDKHALTLQDEIAGVIDRAVRGQDAKRRVLPRRLGLDGEQRPTLRDLGEVLGLSHERVRQLQERGLRRLHAECGTDHRGSEVRAVVIELLGDVEGVDPVALGVIAGKVFPASLLPVAIRTLLAAAGVAKAEAIQLQAAAANAITRAAAATAAAATREVAPLRRLMARAEHPGDDRPADLGIAQFDAARTVAWGERTGMFWSKKLDRPVCFESGMELTLLRMCERDADVEWYQEQPLHVGYEFRGVTRPYFPDVLIKWLSGSWVLVEVKPVNDMAMAINRAKWDAARQWCAEQGVDFLVTDLRVALSDLLSLDVDAALVDELATQLAAGSVRWPAARQMLDSRRARSISLAAACQQQGWNIEGRPWRIVAPD